MSWASKLSASSSSRFPQGTAGCKPNWNASLIFFVPLPLLFPPFCKCFFPGTKGSPQHVQHPPPGVAGPAPSHSFQLKVPVRRSVRFGNFHRHQSGGICACLCVTSFRVNSCTRMSSTVFLHTNEKEKGKRNVPRKKTQVQRSRFLSILFRLFCFPFSHISFYFNAMSP